MKKFLKVFLCILLIAAVGSGITVWILHTNEVDSSAYTEAQHLKRISDRIRKRYINEKTGLTDFNVYPLYNEQEVMEHCLVEFEPAGYFCIEIREKSPILPLWSTGMYLLDSRCLSRGHYQEDSWQRKRIEDDIDDFERFPEIQWKLGENGEKDFFYEIDQNGEYVYHNVSPFQAANVLDEKKYCFKGFKDSTVCIFAVKQDDVYINLVSMQAITADNMGPVAIDYIYKSIFSL